MAWQPPAADFQDTWAPPASDFGEEAHATPAPGILKQGWDALKVPEQKSSEGLKMIAGKVPTFVGGEETRGPDPTIENVIRGVPKVAADTLAEVAPGFVSRTAMIGGAIGKGLQEMPEGVSNFVGDQAARIGKVLSGNKVEDIKNLFNNPQVLGLAPSMAKAKALYGAAVEGAGELPPVDAEKAFDSATKIAQDALAKVKEGTAGPLEALEGRQNLDSVIRATKGTEGKININTSRLKKLNDLRQQLDEVVKSDPGLANADQVYAQAKLASKFRQMFPVNAGGTPSQLKNMLSTAAVTAMHGNPLVPVAMSPLTVGSVTAGLGLLKQGSKFLPQIGQGIGASLGLYKKDQSE